MSLWETFQAQIINWDSNLSIQSSDCTLLDSLPYSGTLGLQSFTLDLYFLQMFHICQLYMRIEEVASVRICEFDFQPYLFGF